MPVHRSTAISMHAVGGGFAVSSLDANAYFLKQRLFGTSRLAGDHAHLKALITISCAVHINRPLLEFYILCSP